ncbi:MAG TPA: VWA domain-containing protein [Clostridia bacterium]|nr:VWA domain-containing protein [Clostridia bacterium]
MRLHLLLAILVLVCPSAVCLEPADASPEPSGTAPLTVVKHVREVRIDFTVSDSTGRLVPGLTAGDLRVYDNSSLVPRLIDFRAGAELALNLVLLIDTSESTRERLGQHQQFARALLEHTFRAGDRLMLASLDSRLRVVRPFTESAADLAQAVSELRVTSLTGLHDAMVEACERHLAHAPSQGRRVLVVITDGQDNVSYSRLDDAVEAALQHGVTVFAVSFTEGDVDRDALNRLHMLSSATGGRAVFVEPSNLGNALEQIGTNMRTSYSLVFPAAQAASQTGFRRVKIVPAKPRDWKISARAGYFLP